MGDRVVRAGLPTAQDFDCAQSSRRVTGSPRQSRAPESRAVESSLARAAGSPVRQQARWMVERFSASSLPSLPEGATARPGSPLARASPRSEAPRRPPDSRALAQLRRRHGKTAMCSLPTFAPRLSASTCAIPLSSGSAQRSYIAIVHLAVGITRDDLHSIEITWNHAPGRRRRRGWMRRRRRRLARRTSARARSTSSDRRPTCSRPGAKYADREQREVMRLAWVRITGVRSRPVGWPRRVARWGSAPGSRPAIPALANALAKLLQRLDELVAERASPDSAPRRRRPACPARAPTSCLRYPKISSTTRAAVRSVRRSLRRRDGGLARALVRRRGVAWTDLRVAWASLESGPT